ncbi:MAG: ABC transporter permease [Chloroflexi bacterium]|nr:ABC transporter permease [Chloroflexota bacterium]
MARQAAVPLELEEQVKIQRPPLGRRLFNLARQHPLGLFGLLTIALLFFAAIFADLIVPFDPQAIDREALLAGPSSSHLLGTDRLGRDVLSRTIFGARISLFIGLVSVIFGVTIGAALGIISGYLGRFVDSVIQRSVDILLAFPAIVLVLAVVTVIGDEDSAVRRFLAEDTPLPEGSFLGIPFFLDIFIISLAIGVAIVAGVTRIVRGAVLSLKENVYVDAARAIGASDARIMWHHIFPNVVALVVILASITLPIAIMAEAAISFLGIGVPVPTPSWGADLTGPNRATAQSGAWWPVFFPGLALSLVVLGFNMLGDAFRDISDPRLRGSLGVGSGGGSRTGGI